MVNPNEQRNRRYRAYNIWQDHINMKKAMSGRLPKDCQRCKLNFIYKLWYVRIFLADDSDMMPVNLTERIRAELKKPFYQEKVRVMMRLYQDVLFWQFGDCGPVMGPQKFTMHNQIERLLSTIYK